MKHKLRGLLQVGHPATLLGAFVHFDVSFMVWVLIGALGAYIARDLNLGPAQKGLLAAIPVLGGSLFRIPVGLLADRFGGRRVGTATMLFILGPLAAAWLLARTFEQILVVGFLLGVAGASFAIALPLASRWYPAEHQGTVLGIAGAGNAGTVIANFTAPRLAEALGWHAVFGLTMIPVLVAAVVFHRLTKDSPNQPTPPPLRHYLTLLRVRDTWCFCALYGVTFGGFVGLASFLAIFYVDGYRLDRVEAGTLAALSVLGGSFVRPVGGFLADRFGGVRMLSFLYAGLSILMFGVSRLPILPIAVALLIASMLFLGMGNGAVFQLVPQRFQRDIGVMTGLVGAAGGFGGFLLPSILGGFRQLTGSYSGGYAVLALAAMTCLVLLRVLSVSDLGWRGEWRGTQTKNVPPVGAT